MEKKKKYEIIERIDVGGMAEIYKAKSFTVQGIEKIVAIKRILPSLVSKPKFLYMFLDEAKLSMKFNHANIVQVFDIGRAGKTYYLIMEYVDGTNLRKLFDWCVTQGYKFSIPVTLFIIGEVCKGLHYAHEFRDEKGKLLNVVHRDVSPSNILISKNGDVKVTDFGLAKALTQIEITDPGIIKGKFGYLSPEAIEGKNIDRRADIFSLGIILWELLTGRRLFIAKTEYHILEQIKKCEVPLPRKIRPEIPPELEEIVMKSLEKKPEKRYQTAKELDEAISDFIIKYSLKVNSYVLSEFLKLYFENKNETDIDQKKIKFLIRDEILNLSLTGKIKPKEKLIDGSLPIQLDENDYKLLNVRDENLENFIKKFEIWLNQREYPKKISVKSFKKIFIILIILTLFIIISILSIFLFKY